VELRGAGGAIIPPLSNLAEMELENVLLNYYPQYIFRPSVVIVKGNSEKIAFV
jgi:hypothetical protein